MVSDRDRQFTWIPRPFENGYSLEELKLRSVGINQDSRTHLLPPLRVAAPVLTPGGYGGSKSMVVRRKECFITSGVQAYHVRSVRHSAMLCRARSLAVHCASRRLDAHAKRHQGTEEHSI